MIRLLGFIVTVCCCLAAAHEHEAMNESSSSSRLRVVSSDERIIKYCADLGPLKEFFATQVEPYYTPLIGLLPEHMQLVLLDESSFGGLSTASCLLVASAFATLLLAWFALAKFIQSSSEASTGRLNEHLVSLKLSLNQAHLKSSTFEHEIGDLQLRLKESESKLKEATERLESFSGSQELTSKETEKLRQNESRAQKEVCSLKLELAEALDRFERQKSEFEAQASEMSQRMHLLEDELTSSRAQTEKLVTELREKEATKVSPTNGPVDSSSETAQLESKTNECLKLVDQLRQLQERHDELQRQFKENEMQLKILNDLREKDTKQHVKSLADLDNQLKKKSSESEKNALLLEQLRAKQERIHDLESQFARIERQSTNERQTHEKQAHETWLQTRKIERELKDARAELTSLRDRLAETEATLKSAQNENVFLKQNVYKLQAGYFMPSPGRRSVEDSSSMPSISESTNGTALTDQLQIDTNAVNQNPSRPPSNASSGSGGGKLALTHQPSPNPHLYKYPTPPPSTFPMLYPQPSPNGMMPPLPPLIPFQSPQHIMMMKMMNQKHLASMAANAAAAKSTPSPNGQPKAANTPSPHHMSYSATFPNGNSTSFLNDSSSNGNLNSPRGSSLEKEDSSSKLESATVNSDLAPTNLAANFEV